MLINISRKLIVLPLLVLQARIIKRPLWIFGSFCWYIVSVSSDSCTCDFYGCAIRACRTVHCTSLAHLKIWLVSTDVIHEICSYSLYYFDLHGTKQERVYDVYLGADKSLAQAISRCVLFDGENISFDVSLVIYINSTNIPLIMIINRIYEYCIYSFGYFPGVKL